MKFQNLVQPFFYKEKAMLLAYDHGLEHGPSDLIGKSFDPDYILDLAQKGKFTGIILQKGIAEKYYWGSSYSHYIPLIMKINGKTNIASTEPYSAINCSVPYAKKLGAQAVGYTIYLGSKREEEMLREFGRVQEEAHQLGMAAIAWIYPRGTNIKDDNSSGITAYAARVGLELGADMIKIKYPGSQESLLLVKRMAGRTKVLLSGGQTIERTSFLKRVKEAVDSEIEGIAVGRNVWQKEDALEFSQKIHQIIWPGE